MSGRTAVALCDGLDAPAELAEELRRALPEAVVGVVAGLSSVAGRGPAFAAQANADRLVLGVRPGGTSAQEVQRAARRAGLDPFAFEIVQVDGDRSRAAALLAAAAAGLRAAPATRPEQLRPRLLTEEAAPVSRGALFTLPPLVYDAVPAVSGARCREPEDCLLCVGVCPSAALAVGGGRVAVDKDRCIGCGRCVTACPAAAVGLPGAWLDAYTATIGALLASERPALLFCCRGAEVQLAAAEAGWLPVELPSIAMATPGWALQALTGGACAVAFCGCQDPAHCPEDALVEQAGYLQTLLDLAGAGNAAARVQLVRACGSLPAPPSLPPFGAAGDSLRLDEPAATAEALRALGGAGSVAAAASPLGVAAVEADDCTLCGSCAAACPTAALRLEEDTAGVSLSFDAGLCVGCARCEPACPEHAIGVERRTDLDQVGRGRVDLAAAQVVRCRDCAAPIAPEALLERIRVLLDGEENGEPLLRILGDRCPDCRGAALALPRLVKGER